MRWPLSIALLIVAALAPPAPAAASRHALVLLDAPRAGTRAHASAIQGFLSRSGVHRVRPDVPEIGLTTVRVPAGETFTGFARRIRADRAVRSVQPEGRMRLRYAPNDPALTAPEPAAGAPAGTTLQPALAAQHLFRAWDFTHGDGALVGIIDTGIAGEHPDLQGKVAVAVDQEQQPSSPATDTSGHGTHVSSLACAATDNGAGMAGAGFNCRVVLEKTDLGDASIAASIVDAANHGVQSINMSFGDDGSRGPIEAIDRAIDYAYDHGVVLVAAAADDAVQEQGEPANVLQPTGTGPDINAGKGLSVTSATLDERPSGAGAGTQVSLAAVGSFGRFDESGGPPGLLGAAPNPPADILDGHLLPPPPAPSCGCRTTFGGASYAYLQGTSMAAPQVAAVAALMRALNPDLTVADVLRIVKQTASRPAGTGWTAALGWGVLDGGAALDAASRVDRRAPTSRASAPKRTTRRVFRVRWSGADRAPAGVVASGIDHFEVYAARAGRRARRIARTRRHSLRFHGAAGVRYAFFTVAVDRAGNRQVRPAAPQARTRVVRR